MSFSRLSDIKRNQKESLIFRVISDLYLQASLEDKNLIGLIPTRASLSSDKSKCFIMFYDPDGLEAFKKKLEILKLYKPSIRAALAKKIKSRYVPDLAFKFDEQFEKEQKIHEILDKVKKEDKF
ncbi:hypothetical protein A3F66_00145 [candidate division TM6 bacterium RIFCSPHIGHO2_12_FULL_32_22]|nr:MAG: hypothetical protein A3F66_00145 [candidate division TM6 bacterium RIFCSPHIGHO2_12_FULL_32_22]